MSKRTTKITDKQRDEAIRILRAEYYSDVRNTARDVIERQAKNPTAYAYFNEDIWQTAENCEWVLCPARSLHCLMASHEREAIDDNIEDAPNVLANHLALAACYAYRADLEVQITAELGTDPTSWTDDDWSAFARFLYGKPTALDTYDHDEQLNAAEIFKNRAESR